MSDFTANYEALPKRLPYATEQAQEVEEDSFSLRDMWMMFAPKWKWFALSLFVIMAIATAYLITTPAIYLRSASILIQDNKSNSRRSLQSVSGLRDMGLFDMASNVNDELYVIQSPSLMMEVTKRLRLNDVYVDNNGLRPVDLYGETPVLVTLRRGQVKESVLNKEKKKAPSFEIKIISPDTVELSNFAPEDGDPLIVVVGQTVRTPVGVVAVTMTNDMSDEWIGRTVEYTHRSSKMTALAYNKEVEVELQDKNANILQLSLKDTSPRRAEDILSALIDEYNKAWVKDNNRMAIATSQFITERLELIEQELGSVDSHISNYKSSTLVPDVTKAAESYMQQSAENKNKLFEVTNQLAMAEFMRDELSKEDITQVLPSNVGVGSQTLEQQISTYNNMVLERERLITNSSENNPVVRDLTKSLHATQKAIIRAVDNLVSQYKGEIAALHGKEADNMGRIAQAPGQAKHLLSVERQQKVQEALYLYLLQKREENEISMTFTAYNTRIVSEPDGNLNPVAPSGKKVLLIAFVFGLAIPAGIIYLMETMNTRVRGRRDLAKLTTPFIGELPLYKPKDSTVDISNTAVVQENNIDFINEAMRVLRTNIEFMRDNAKGAPVFMTTSMNVGSGKTFITINLATSFAIKGKRVAVVDLDLRMHASSEYANNPKKGVSSFLGGMVDDWHSIVVKGATHANLDLLPAGVVPPNPTELLTLEKLDKMVAELKESYDLVFLDCPPVDIVADTNVISRVADNTMFVIRAGLMEREMLPRIDEYYTEKKLPGMGVILNATTFRSHDRYSYNYGYGGYGRCGYHYGYGYGKDNKKKS